MKSLGYRLRRSTLSVCRTGLTNWPRQIQTPSSNRPSAPPATASEPLKDFSEIPGPRQYPVLKSLPSLMLGGFEPAKVHLFYKKMFAEYGPIIKLALPQMPNFVITMNPDDIAHIYRITMKNPLREGFDSFKKIRMEGSDYFGGKGGILTENGEEWWRVRSRVQAPLMKPKNVAMYLPKVDEATLKLMDRIDELQTETGQTDDQFLQELYKWALECVGFVAFNKELGCLEPNLSSDSVPMQLIDNVNKLFSALNETEMNFPWWKYFKTKAYTDLEVSHDAFLKVADQSIQEALESFKEAQKSGDASRRLSVMETFLQTEGLSKTDVTTIVLDMLFAGVDTTSHTLVFALYALAMNPKSQKKLQEEIDKVMGDSAKVEPYHIAEMVYLNRVLKESLRLYPIVTGFLRTIPNETSLSGYRVPEGTWAIGFNMLIGQSEKYFQRADEFIPERWNRDRPFGEIHPYASLPFSFGTRMCIGKRIAEQEIYTFLIRVLQKYSITFENKEEMKIRAQLVMRPDIPLAFKFHARK